MRTVRKATTSGFISAKRFGIKSANKIKEAVTIANANQEEALSTQAASVYWLMKACKCTRIVALTNHPAKHGNHVQTDLHHGDETPRLFL